MKRKKVVSKTIRPGIFHYALPPFLLGVISQKDYCDWLERKGHNLRQGDTKLKRPYAKENTVMVYKQKIHQAVLDGGEFDPYTGEKINWGLISKEKNLKKGDYIDNYLNRYAMYPAVDHIIPGEFEFEICSWISNESKSSMTPDEFVDFCRKVVSFRGPAMSWHNSRRQLHNMNKKGLTFLIVSP
jgi:hypothetical protein